MSAGFGLLGLDPQALQQTPPSPQGIPTGVDQGLQSAGLPSMSSVLSGMMNGATGDAQAVGDMGGRIGSMLSGMVGRTGDLVEKFRSGQIGAGEFMSAAAGRAKDMATSAVTAPRDAYTGDLQVFGPDGHPTQEAMDRANGMAGLAMTGSMPFKAPAGAIRSFGGAASGHADDPMAALEASLANIKPEAPPPGPRTLDPNAQSWDVYHGSHTGPDFARFDPNVGSNKAEHGAVFFAPNPETASGYAGQIGSKATGEAGPRVYRTTVEPGKSAVFDLAHLVENDPSFNTRARDLTVKHEGATWGPVFDDAMSDFARNRAEHRSLSAQAEAMGYPASRPEGVPFGYGHIGAAVQMAKEQGLDTAIIRGLGEHGGDDQLIALTPGRVRSYYDPSQLLYSGGPSGLLGALPLMATPTSPPGKARP